VLEVKAYPVSRWDVLPQRRACLAAAAFVTKLTEEEKVELAGLLDDHNRTGSQIVYDWLKDRNASPGLPRFLYVVEEGKDHW
jgi:hypothetical protein